MITTEKKFWQEIRKRMPPRTVAYRIESATYRGLPDAQIIWHGQLLMCELKVVKTRGQRIAIRASQQAFAAQLWAAGYANYFVLVAYDSDFSYIRTHELLAREDWKWSDIAHLARPVAEFDQWVRARVEEAGNITV